MGDMAYLARAVIFVMGVPIKVSDYLYTQYKYRQGKGDSQQTLAWVLRHNQRCMTPGSILVRTQIGGKHVSSDCCAILHVSSA